ncbi:hypothetical protein GJ496_005692 [Pomphorhynchus laevis]|nr:hypothetical protein GJ496_005692 [Pomphorhynchus laevis]
MVKLFTITYLSISCGPPHVKESATKQFPCNIAPYLQRAVMQIRNDLSIIVKRADDGNQAIILSRTEYITNATRQLGSLTYGESTEDQHKDATDANSNFLVVLTMLNLICTLANLT